MSDWMEANEVSIRLGSDLVHIPRLEKSWRRHGEAFFLKLLSETEWRYCCQGHPKLWMRRAAGRIAVKEAVAKALGCGLNGLGWGEGIHWRDLEVISMEKAAPQLRVTGQAAFFQKQLNIVCWRISFSHDGDYAFATVLGLPPLSVNSMQLEKTASSQ
jgi:holo-[acyl-carrier protein] synthase